MNWKTAIPIAVVVGIAAFILARWVEDRLPDTVDPGARERDSLNTKSHVHASNEEVYKRVRDSVLATIPAQRPIEVVRENNTRYLDGASVDTLRAILRRHYQHKQ